MTDEGRTAARDWEAMAAAYSDSRYVLHLYVSGMSPRSIAAITRLMEVLDEHLRDRYELEVIDIYQQPELARQEQVIATPTLIKRNPLPMKRLVGDLSRGERVLAGLGLGPQGKGHA